MLPSPFGSRLPRYEGHLTLNQAILSDSPQTSAGTAWSERWCSLEDGNLLVYHDRTAAMVNPHQTCTVIDVRNFVCVQSSTITIEPSHELVLSMSHPEPARSSRLFRHKSAMSLSRLQADSAPRDITEFEPRSSMASTALISFQSRQPSLSASLTFPAKTDGESRLSSRSKPWAKLASGSRKLYSKISTSSAYLRTNDSLPRQSTSTASSVASISDSRPSTDITSSGAPSPRTPFSTSFSRTAERVPIRIPSLDALNSWLDAFTLTIKMHNELALPSSPIIKQQKRVFSRPSLGSLPGFRTPIGLQPTLTFPTVTSADVSMVEESTPKASRKRQSSSTSLPFVLHASQDLQHKAADCPSRPSTCYPRKSLEKPTIGFTATEHITTSEPLRRPSAAHAPSSFNPHAFAAGDTKRPQQDRKNKRSLSTASSSLSFSATGPTYSSPRRNSISSAHLLSSAGLDASDARPPRASLNEPLLSSRHSNPDGAEHSSQVVHELADKGDIITSTSGGYFPSSTRHRRSGSILRLGSARILAWRDNFTSSESIRTVTPVGLGLLVDEKDLRDSSRADWGDTRPKRKLSRGFPSLRSFCLLSKNKADGKDGDVSLQNCEDGNFSLTLPSEPRRGEDVLACHTGTLPRSAIPPKGKGMSKTMSLLNLSKQTIGSFREKSNPREGVKPSFAVPQEDTTLNDFAHDNDAIRVQSPGGDFSYELVASSCEPSPTGSDVLSTGSAALEKQWIVADDGGASKPVQVQKLSLDDTAQTGLSRVESRIGESNDVSPPSLTVERILPPEQIISTFDQLRAADPTGRSCDWLSHIETASRRGSLDGADAASACRKSLRLAASQTFDLRGGSMELTGVSRNSGSGVGPRLRSSMSAWDLPSAPRPERETLRRHLALERETRDATAAQRVEELLGGRPSTPRLSEEVSHTDTRLRSLPAPPRASKRRARISTYQPPPLLPAISIQSTKTPPKPLSDLTNTDLPDLQSLVLHESTPHAPKHLHSTPPPKSPSRKLGSKLRRPTTPKSSPRRVRALV